MVSNWRFGRFDTATPAAVPASPHKIAASARCSAEFNTSEKSHRPVPHTQRHSVRPSSYKTQFFFGHQVFTSLLRKTRVLPELCSNPLSPASLIMSSMALRLPTAQLCKTARPSSFHFRPSLRCAQQQMRWLATPTTHPVTQKNTGTAMVFLNMGGPSTLDEVGDFLSRLFVCS